MDREQRRQNQSKRCALPFRQTYRQLDGQQPEQSREFNHGVHRHRRSILEWIEINAAKIRVNVVPCRFVKLTANSTANNPNRVVNLITGFIATDEVSLNGSPTVSPTTVAS